VKKAKKAQRKFFKTVFTVTVLSEGHPLSAHTELKVIEDAITEGDCVGEIELSSAYRLTRKEVVKELAELRSVPQFFGLDERGRDLP
jgi:hypothetical protein